jgi:hypothetical protein
VNCFVEILDRAVVVALLLVGIAAAVIGSFSIRVQVNCFVEIPDRAVLISLIVIAGAAVVVDDGQIFRRILARLDKRRASGDFWRRDQLTGTCSGFLACSAPSQPSPRRGKGRCIKLTCESRFACCLV